MYCLLYRYVNLTKLNNNYTALSGGANLVVMSLRSMLPHCLKAPYPQQKDQHDNMNLWGLSSSELIQGIYLDINNPAENGEYL